LTLNEGARAGFRLGHLLCKAFHRNEDNGMANKHSRRGRKQDRSRVAGGQDYEFRYEAKKTGRSKAAVKKVGNAY
jgi:hypothetical protein